MKVIFSSKNDFERTRSWLSNVINKSPAPILRKIAVDGERKLAENTPKDTGETASGWRSELNIGRDSSVISWYNVAHPHTRNSVALMIELGHGTRTGGYVPPRPYIRQSMDNVYKKIDAKMEREMFE